MSKYSFERLGAHRFETMSQALLEQLFRVSGNLVQFGDGKDGAREATWSQSVGHSTYQRPLNVDHDVPKEWVFQVKFHDIGLRGWASARADVDADLSSELDKIVHKYKVPCHKYVMITNVPFSGVRNVGTRDRVDIVIKNWQPFVPEIEVWDAVDLSRMLDADPGTRTTYLDDVLPGDVLRAFLTNMTFRADRRISAFHAYLKSLLRSERDAKAEEAGDESGLELEKIFVDLNLRLIPESSYDFALACNEPANSGADLHHIPRNFEQVPSSFAFLRAEHKTMLLKGGPGVGKSTITQFLTLYHASRLVDPLLAVRLARRLKLTGGVSPSDLDAHCRVRFPVRVELRRYAQWMSDPTRSSPDTFLARYIAERIGIDSSAELTMDDVFFLASENPLILILDGLDEVPRPDLRGTIFRELLTFLDRCEGESCDIQLILSSRPQGYRGEFADFDPLEWHVIDLARSDFDDYADRWLKERIRNADEMRDARKRIDVGLQAPAVQQLASTLLQATVMLIIASRKHAIPHARHSLYAKYVEVIFDREQNKKTVRERGKELLKLHEIVGFRLIRKMESVEGAQTLGGEEFSQCVQKVINDYGRLNLGAVTIGQVVDDIVTLAKDRLCLLVGKGEDQQDVDFAIQPFREYFAAAYLANHEDASPDQVYQSLVDRRHIWGQVLQFYSALQSTAQQKNWISEADGTTVNQQQFDGLVQMTRSRRALVGVLPEVARPKNEYIHRAFRNVFDAPTRWTWRDREDTASLLNAFAPDESFGVLEQLFGDLSLQNTANLYVEIDLLAKSSGPEDKKTVRERLQKLLSDERFQSLVIQVAYSNDIELNYNGISFETMSNALSKQMELDEDARPNFVSGLSDALMFDLTFLGWHGHIPLVDAAMPERVSVNTIRDVWRSFASVQSGSTSGVRGILPSFTYDRRGSLSPHIVSQIEQSDARCAPYLIALLRAIDNPTDPELFQQAKVHEVELGEHIHSLLAIDSQLGPAPTEFASTEEWVAARNETLAASKELGERWLRSVDDHMFVSTLFHPDAWPMLDRVISEDQLAKLISEYQSTVRSLFPFSMLPLRLLQRSRKRNVDLFQLCKCVVGVSRKYGHHFVRDGRSVAHILAQFECGGNTCAELNELLDNAIDAGSDLLGYWAAIIVRVCSAKEGVDVVKLLTLWGRHCFQQSYWVSIGDRTRPSLVEQILNIGTDDAIACAASLAPSCDRNDDGGAYSRVADRVVHSLCDLIETSSGNEKLNWALLLLDQALHVDELAIWAMPENVNVLVNESWGLHRLAERLMEFVNESGRFDQGHLREQLGIFIDRRDEFPVKIALGALEAILRLDEINATPLVDRDWQRQSD